ncbi:uncharacterized protein [Drosophila pseudoobscura]|uniref:Uncharacterized protein n=1 Tax=Drosophila pseudoobscura pseudoobscura TaxID=46245 RepID=A0A6I8UHZ6_DROPS|nr:uncharacterized protein LOC4816175 [Drosophila pseudoobscura]
MCNVSGSRQLMSSSMMNVWSFRCFVILCLLLITICLIDGAKKKNNKYTTPNKYKRVFTIAVPRKSRASRKPMKAKIQRRSVTTRKNTTDTPYVESIKDQLLRKKPIQDVHDIVRSSYDHLRHLHILYVSQSAVNLTLRTLERKPKDMTYTCGYRRITTNPMGLYINGSINRAVETPFHDTYIVPEDVMGLIAICKDSRGDVLQVQPFTFVQSIHQSSNQQPKSHRRPSVIMFGFNGMTPNDFRSTLDDMPGLKSNREGWFEMQNYKRMGENSYINLMALISGYSPSAVHNLQSASDMDAMPFIWKQYKEKGYLTAYAEDLTLIRKFAFEFGKQPVDYYLRPFMRGIADSLHLRNRSTEYHGLGRRLYVDYVYDYCQQLLERYLNHTQPFFGLFWTSNFVTEQNRPKREPTLMDYIKRFEQLGLFSEAIVIFFSDHVCHPMLFVWLPSWVRLQYPDISVALAINTQRMTSPHDLYLTLQDILNLGTKVAAHLLQPEGCPTCLTLFKEIPTNRTCHEAGRSENYCDCASSMELLQEETEMLPLGWLLVDSLNNYLRSRNLINRCEAFSLQKVESIHQHSSSLKSSTIKYRVRFTTQPKAARFLATVLYNHDTNQLVNVSVPTFGRLLRYTHQSKCVKDGNDKKFCVCKSLPKKKKKRRILRRRKNKPGAKKQKLLKSMDSLMKKVEKIEKLNALSLQQIKVEMRKLKEGILTSTTAPEWITYLEPSTTPMSDVIETHVNFPLTLNF